MDALTDALRDQEGHPAVQNASPAEIRQWMDAGLPVRLIDVREGREWDYCRIEGAELMPLSQIQEWSQRISPNGGPYVVYCHTGVRSLMACRRLAALGVERLINMRGGIDRWSQQVDSSIPRY
jgi:sulfur-carrier protein adenylyltransferase/sulfurtransferase